MKTKKTRPDEFKKFHFLLTKTLPFKPWYFKLGRDKNPLKDIPWKSLKGKMTPKQAYQWMAAGFNVGVAATSMDPLMIIDIDDIVVTPDSVMEPTLTVTSRKRLGRHYFYFTSDPRCKMNMPTDKTGEIRSVWEYVVAPGSYVETAQKLIDRVPDDDKCNVGYYTISNKISPKYITYNNIPNIFITAIENEKKLQESKKLQKSKNSDNTSRSALFKLSAGDMFNVPDKEKHFPSLFHGSETGKNTSIEKGWIMCWRHNVSHSALSALAVMSGMATCQEAGWGHKNAGVGPSTLDFKDGKTIYELWKYAKKNGFIPEDDRIPYSAYLYLDKNF